MLKRSTFQKTPSAASRRAKALERYLLQVIVSGCVIIGALGASGVVATAVNTLTSTEVQVRDLYAPADTETSFVDFPGVTSADAPTANITVTGLPSGARWWLVAADVLPALAGIALAVALALIAVGVLKGRPFQRSVTWGLGAYAILYLIGEWGHSALTGIAHAEVWTHLIGTSDSVSETFTAPFSISISPEPLAWAIALAVIAGAFELGQRMQRDTEGLV